MNPGFDGYELGGMKVVKASDVAALEADRKIWMERANTAGFQVGALEQQVAALEKQLEECRQWEEVAQQHASEIVADSVKLQQQLATLTSDLENAGGFIRTFDQTIRNYKDAINELEAQLREQVEWRADNERGLFKWKLQAERAEARLAEVVEVARFYLDEHRKVRDSDGAEVGTHSANDCRKYDFQDCRMALKAEAVLEKRLDEGLTRREHGDR